MTRRPSRTQRVGRRLALHDETRRDRFLTAVRAGVPIGHAAASAGLGQSTIFRYVNAAELIDTRLRDTDTGDIDPRALADLPPDDRALWEFGQELSRARADVAVRGVALIQKVAQGGTVISETTRTYRDDQGRLVTETDRKYAAPDAKPVQWLLERSFREDFGRQQAVEVTGAGGGPVQLQVGALEDLGQRLHALVQAREVEDAEWVEGDVVQGEIEGG